MIQKLPPVPELPFANGEAESGEDDDGDQECSEETLTAEEPGRVTVDENVHEIQVSASDGPVAVSTSAEDRSAPPGDVAETQPQQQTPADVHPIQAAAGSPAAQGRHVVPQPSSDSTLTFLAIALTIAILALIIKKLMRSQAIVPESLPPKL